MSYSEDNSYEKILSRALSNSILDNIDKRQGSIIYDAIAPLCLELAEVYAKLDIFQDQTYVLTATGDNLDNKAYEFGISRIKATYAERTATFKKYNDDKSALIDIDIPEGSRFVSEGGEYTYEYIGIKGIYKVVKCEQIGTQGDIYAGNIIPLVSITGLVLSLITGSYIPAEDTETDESLRQRIKDKINYTAFGGNIADYIQKVNSITGVGNTKVFPAWQENGSVLLSVVDTQYQPITSAFASQIKEIVDPLTFTGQGVGTAPIGHYVTITTPTNYVINISLTLVLSGASIAEIYQDVLDVITNYFNSLRRTYSQNVIINVYRSNIISLLLTNIESIISVTTILLNGVNADITLIDTSGIGTQYLPSLGTVELYE